MLLEALAFCAVFGACALPVGLRRWMFFKRYRWPRRKSSFANSQRSGSTFRKPCSSKRVFGADFKEDLGFRYPWSKLYWLKSESLLATSTLHCNCNLCCFCDKRRASLQPDIWSKVRRGVDRSSESAGSLLRRLLVVFCKHSSVKDRHWMVTPFCTKRFSEHQRTCCAAISTLNRSDARPKARYAGNIVNNGPKDEWFASNAIVETCICTAKRQEHYTASSDLDAQCFQPLSWWTFIALQHMLEHPYLHRCSAAEQSWRSCCA